MKILIILIIKMSKKASLILLICLFTIAMSNKPTCNLKFSVFRSVLLVRGASIPQRGYESRCKNRNRYKCFAINTSLFINERSYLKFSRTETIIHLGINHSCSCPLFRSHVSLDDGQRCWKRYHSLRQVPQSWWC